MIHSIIPLEVIYESNDMNNKMSSTIMCHINGLQLEVMPIHLAKGQIVRLVNAPLGAYLDPAFSPGSIVHLPLQ